MDTMPDDLGKGLGYFGASPPSTPNRDGNGNGNANSNGNGNAAATSNTPPLMNGKVLRLHFACRAELPHGSSLRVTSSNLWAYTAGSSTTHNSSTAASSTGFNGSGGHGADGEEGDLDDVSSEQHAIYTSSVEMVTSPSEYPLWKTRTPVVCVVNSVDDEGIFNHRYRYLVVTPGVGIAYNANDDDDDSDNGRSDGFNSEAGRASGMTSDGDDGFVHVTMWEDPFKALTHGDDTRVLQRTLEDLPYRSIDVDVSSPTSDTSRHSLEEKVSASDTTSLDITQRTIKGQRIDYFNRCSDLSFNTYRDILELEKKEKEKDHSSASSSDENSEKEGSPTTEDDRKKQRLFLVCYHLPVKLTRDVSSGKYHATFSESLLAKTEASSVSKSHETYWVGTVSLNVDDDHEKEQIREVLKPLNCIPLFLDDTMRQSFYFGMCKQVLWPAFHNIDLLDMSKSGWGQQNHFDNEGHVAQPVEFDSNWDQSRLDVWWNAFQAVNKIFCDAIMKIVRMNDIVWVHDYHLSLLPKLLHEAEMNFHGMRSIQMVFFLHIPFPTSQVFRELERGENILEGILHADVVGFHAFDHARHFLNAAKRILGLSHESLVGGLIGVKYRGTKVLVTISNVSIEADVVRASLTSDAVKNEADHLKAKYAGRSIVGGVDIAQGLSGVSLKLLAFERLLADYPNWREKVAMMQVCLVPSSRKNDEADTLSHVRYLVKRIQNSFGSDVIGYEEVIGSSLPIERRLALWLASDVFMTTPIREGLNLLPLEYVFARDLGVTITTEFSAVCSVLNGALRINPFDIQASSTCIDTALSMAEEEKVGRRERDMKFVSSSNSGSWTHRVLGDLKDVTKSAIKGKGGDSRKRQVSNMDSVQAVSELHIASQRLDQEQIVDAYHAAETRVIFVDFNGTIVMKEPAGKYLKRDMLGTSGNKPPSETIKALTKLSEDPRNVVYVVSGDTESNIQQAIGDIPGIGLASGNGGSISHPIQRGERRKWKASDLGVDWETIKKIVLPIVSKYTARANGSFVKLTSSSIGWSYYSCDPEWGSMLSVHLVQELENELHAFDVRLVTLKGVVEVVPRKLNKGLVVKDVLRRKKLPDFILCMGDDVSDEKMFTSVFSVISQSSADDALDGAAAINPKHAITVTVGKKVSNASYYVEDASVVAELLIKMARLQYKGRTMSWDADDLGPARFET